MALKRAPVSSSAALAGSPNPYAAMPAARRIVLPVLLPALMLGLVACGPRTVKETATAPDASSAVTPATAESRPAALLGPTVTLVDKDGRPLECVILAKQRDMALVRRTSDQQKFVIEFDRLSAGSRDLLASYRSANTAELQAFLDERDYAAAKRLVKVEMISATWCGYCTKSKEFFASERIPYDAYDHESQTGKQRQQEWGSTSLPTVKIGDKVIRGYSPESFRSTLLREYRKRRGAVAEAT